MSDQMLEQELRDALRAELGGLPVRLTGADLRARVRPTRAWWSRSMVPLAAAVILVTIAVALTILARPPLGDVAGTPVAPPVSVEPAPTASASPDASNTFGPTETPGQEPTAVSSAEPTPSGSPAPSSRPALVPPGTGVLTFRNGRALEVTALSPDGTLASLATIADFETLLLPDWDIGMMSVSRDGFLAVSVSPEIQTFVFDLYDAGSAPLVMDGAFGADFGPTDLLAVSGERGIEILDPRSGITTRLVGRDADQRYWLADGTGFLAPGSEGPSLWLLDGSRQTLDGPLPALQPPDGSRDAPDDRRSFSGNGGYLDVGCPGSGDSACVGVQTYDGEPLVRWGVGADPAEGVGQWDAGGTGLWFVAGPDESDRTDGLATIAHFAAPAERDRTISFAVSDYRGFRHIQFAPDDAFVILDLADGRLMFLDLRSGQSQILGQPGADWQLAGWIGFPDYPVAGYETPPEP